ncbi:MAG: EamA family transporter [Gemmatimonadales bacterium]
MPESTSWFTWAVLSGVFAALTAIFAKIGLEEIGDASRVAPIDKLSVVLVAVFAVAFLGERPSARDWLGIGCVGVGVALLSLRR